MLSIETTKIIEDWLKQYSRVNPSRVAPTVTYDKGWFIFTNSDLFSVKYRKAKLIRVTENLRAEADRPKKTDVKTHCIISVDGKTIISGDMTAIEAHTAYNETLQNEVFRAPGRQTEYALQVYKPRHGGYLREKWEAR